MSIYDIEDHVYYSLIKFVNGLPLTIDGGDYRLCKNADEICGEAECKAKRGICGNPTAGSFVNVPKGGKMKIAVTYENGNVFQHFGHSSEFKIYDIENDAVAKSEVIGTGGEGHGALATLLAEQKVDILICNNIGQDAKQALAEIGVKLYPSFYRALTLALLKNGIDLNDEHVNEFRGAICYNLAAKSDIIQGHERKVSK